MSLDGHVIGINTAIASNSNGIGFAFALSQARIDYILKSITTSGRIKRPFIGINYIPNSPDVAQEL
jgi:S1-C subfamily serine protease